MKGNVKQLLTFVFAVLISSLAYAQVRTYSGVVKFASDGTSVPMANIMIQGTKKGATSDLDGKYTISAPQGSKLVFSFVGMQNQIVVTGSSSVINVNLESDQSVLDEMVVVAFGTSSKKDLTGSVSSIDAKTLSKQQVSSVSKALEGTVSGVQIMSPSGQPGDDAKIQIRGMGSLNADASALIVVDGVPYLSGLSSLNPDDIESMVVSKDASSNSLYGSRAANGVILVTTKKGKSGQARIGLQVRTGANTQGIESMPVIGDPGEYYAFVWKTIYNKMRYDSKYLMNDQQAREYASKRLFNHADSGGRNGLGYYQNYAIPEGKTLIDPTTGKLTEGARLLYHDDWNKELTEVAFRQEYNLSISGGNDKTDYYMSLGYLSDPSYVIKSRFDRYSGRFNVNTKVNDWLKTGVNMSYSRRNSNRPNYTGGTVNTNVFVFTRWLAPIVPLYAYDLDGNRKYDKYGNVIYDLGTGQTDSPLGTTARPFFGGYSPGIYLDKDKAETVTDDISGRAYLEANFLNDFKFTVNFSMDNSYAVYTGFGNNESGTAARDYNGSITKKNSKNVVLNTQQLLNWNKRFGKHSFAVLLGHEFFYNTYEEQRTTKYNVFFPGMDELDNAIVMSSATGSSYKELLEGYLSKVEYNYDSKYYINASYRADGSSKFKYNKWGHFWSVGLSWRISQENFIADNASWVNDLKLRASYGTNGNKNVTSTNYPYTDLWQVANSGGQISISQSTVGNPNLTWETNHTFDAGIDFRLFNRFWGTFDYYYRKTKDLIWERPMPASTGMGKRLENVGALANYGVELELGADLIKNSRIHWSVSLNGSMNRSKLLELPEEMGESYIDGNYLRGIGRDYYTFYINKYAGVDPATGAALLYKQDEDGNISTTKLQTEATKFEAGSAIPDVVGGFSTNFTWGNFDASIITSYQIGGKVLSSEYSALTSPGRIGFNVHTDMLKAWTEDNKNSNVPVLWADGTNITAGSTRYLFDASYFNIKSVTVGYKLPQEFISKIKMSRARVFLSVENLAFFSSKKGLDPRVSFDGSGGPAFGFPQTRSMSIGFNLDF